VGRNSAGAHVKRQNSCRNFCGAMLCISAAYAVVRCPSICLSVRLSVVTFVYSVETNIHICKIFSPVSPRQTLWLYCNGDLTNGGVKCRLDKQKSRFSTNIWLHRVLSTVRPPSVIYAAALEPWKVCNTHRWYAVSFVVRGRWSTRCLWQEASTLYNRTEFNSTQW